MAGEAEEGLGVCVLNVKGSRLQDGFEVPRPRRPTRPWWGGGNPTRDVEPIDVPRPVRGAATTSGPADGEGRHLRRCQGR
ncbi:hypothetical protein GCM10027162_10140 [Streptomyces incanus]